MILAIIGVIIGFVLLVKGADFFVEGSGSVAKKFNVPVFIIGMTIVAMGTSAPECAVSISASLHGSNGMAINPIIPIITEPVRKTETLFSMSLF